MSFRIQPYSPLKDYERVYDFLERLYSLDRPPLNWSPQRWEYMHYHPLLDKCRSQLKNFGLWFDQDEPIAIAHFEHEPGVVYFELDPNYPQLKPTLFEYAEKKLVIKDKKNRKTLCLYLQEKDQELNQLAKKRAYRRQPKKDELVSLMIVKPEKLHYEIPAGFKIQSLADDNNLRKLHHLFHRGFNHPGEPDDRDLPGRKKMQQAPHYRKDLNVIAMAPNGDYASVCGGWYHSQKKYAFIEPVCTDPDYRLKGLGRAVVLEMIRRCYRQGAQKAIVGSGQEFYRRLGFEYFFKKKFWRKIF